MSLIESRLKEAIESERYADVSDLLKQYSACVAEMYESGHGGTAEEQKVKALMSWAHDALTAGRAHAVGQFQRLSEPRPYTSSNPDRKTWQIML